MKRSLRSWLWSVPLEQEVDEELAFHREMRAREQQAAGIDPGVRDTLMTIGRKRDRDMRVTRWLEELWIATRFALRQMRRAPGFTAVAVLTLALGIGANTAMFALADAVLLRPLPFPHADRLVTIEEWGPQQGGRSRVELLNLYEWQRESRTFEAMAAVWVPGGDGANMVNGTSEKVAVLSVSPRFFDVLGVTAIHGRTFVDADDGPDPSVMVIGEGLWRRRFGGDPTILGRAITVNDRQASVVGIVPDSFEFMRPAGMWTLLPLPAAGAAGANRGQCGVCRVLRVVGRIRPGLSTAAAQTEMTSLANAIAMRNGDTRRPRRIVITPFRDLLIGKELRPPPGTSGPSCWLKAAA